MSGQKRLIGMGEVVTFLYSAPLALAGLFWLIAATDPRMILENLPGLIILGILMFVFRKLSFFMIVEIRTGRYATSDGSMDGMILWTGIFLFGPSALWLAVLLSALDFAWRWHSAVRKVDRWNRLRNFSFYLASTLLAPLISLLLYRSWGGEIPLSGLDPRSIFLGLTAVLTHTAITFLIWSGFIANAIWTQVILTKTSLVWPIVRFLFTGIGLPNLSHPFAILLAGLFTEHGLTTFSFVMVGLLLVAILARQLSWAAENSRQQSRQLEKLETLGRAIIGAPPDASTLPDLLQEYVPSMFPSGRVIIWLAQDHLLLKHPQEWDFETEPVWKWLETQNQPVAFVAQEPLPWLQDQAEHNAFVITPILDADTNLPIGGVYLELFSLVQPWDSHSLAGLYPALLSLAAQVSSALHQADVYSQALAYQRVSQELSLAGKIQASFLPDELPKLSGWELSVTLLPARETSGDYFDLISLSNGKLGILIADVTDKGVGAALYMALSRTLIRTYAIEFDDDPQPEVIFFAANGRLLKDARADMFVTAFYGILDPATGEMTYCNAGHNPPYLFKANADSSIQALVPTGMPIGIEEDIVWGQETVQIDPGDMLLLYTDGIPDAQNNEGEFFEDKLLLETASRGRGCPAHEVQEMILEEVQEFSEGASQFDDITLMVLVRDAG